MGQLRCVFDVVRLVDPEKMQVLDDGAGGSTRGCSYPQCHATFLQYVNNYDQQFYQDVLTGADNQAERSRSPAPCSGQEADTERTLCHEFKRALCLLRRRL